MHEMDVGILADALSLRVKSISGNCDPDLLEKFRYSKNGYREILFEKIFTQEKFWACLYAKGMTDNDDDEHANAGGVGVPCPRQP